MNIQNKLIFLIKNSALILILLTLYDLGFNYLWNDLFIIEMPNYISTLFDNKVVKNIIWLQFWHTISLIIPSIVIGFILMSFRYPLIKASIISLVMASLYVYVVGASQYFNSDDIYTLVLRVVDIIKVLFILPLVVFFISKFNQKLKFNF